MDTRVKPAYDAKCVGQRLARFPDPQFQTAKRPRSRVAARGELL